MVAVKERGPKKRNHVIPAEAHSDDWNVQIKFDAEKWFAQAGDEEILALAKCGFGGDYPADRVAEFFDKENPDIRGLFFYLGAIKDNPLKKDCCGFECRVAPGAALLWIQKNRPDLYARANAFTHDIRG